MFTRVAGPRGVHPSNAPHTSQNKTFICIHFFPLLHEPCYDTACVGAPYLLGQSAARQAAKLNCNRLGGAGERNYEHYLR